MASDRTIANENFERFSYARDNGHLDFITRAEQCDDYFRGAQWDAATRNRLERLGKPVLTINKILSTCATIFGEQLQNRADVSFRPARDADPETAQVLDKLWLHIAETNNLDWLESEVAADGFIRGRGFFDVRVDFDDQFMGEARIRQLNSKNVLIDPDAESYDPDEWKEVFISKWLTPGDLERIYGDSASREVLRRPNASFTHNYDALDWEPDAFGTRERTFYRDDENMARRIYRVIERQHKDMRNVEFLVNPNTGDMRETPSQWERERIQFVMQQYGLVPVRRRVEKIRWTVSLDDILLHDAWSPLKHFTPVPFFPYFRHGTAMGVVENLISPQDLLNKSISQELHIVNTTANSGYIVKNGSLANMTVEDLEERGGEDGLVISVNGSPRDIEKIQPNQVPTGVDRLSFKADEALKEVSMISDSMRGFDRADVAAKAIQAKKAMGTVSLTKPFDNLSYTRKLVARNVLDLVQTYYTEERMFLITGRGLTDQPQQVTVNQASPEGTIVNDLTVGEYSVVVSTVPARESFEQSQFAEALEMRQLGIAIPDDVLVEHSHLARKGELAARIKQLNGGGEPSQAAQQMQQLDMQAKQVDIDHKQSAAELNRAKAQKEAQGDSPAMQEAELTKLAMEREKMLAEHQLKMQMMQEKMALETRKLEMQIEVERAKLEAQREIQQQKVEFESERMQQELYQQRVQSEQQMTLDHQRTQQELALGAQQAEHQMAMDQAQMQQQAGLEERRLQQSQEADKLKADTTLQVAKERARQPRATRQPRTTK